MQRFGRRIARGSGGACQHALALLLMVALAGVPACSRESTPPAPPASESPAAEAPARSEDSATAEPASAEEAKRVASDDVKALVAPIALYPDPLLELVLQASAQPGQVVLASRFLDGHAQDPSLQPDPSWDTAVVGLLNTPDVLAMMNESLDWTTALGQAVANDLEEVQLAVQELRWTAFNMRALESNEYQDVIATGGMIAILPARREQVAVPQYDGAALLESSSVPESATALAPTDPGGAAPGDEPYAAAPAGGYAYAPQPVPVSYASPQPSFWSSAALFAGGAALGGLIGYAIGHDDDDDDDYHGWGWGWDDDWDDRPWGGYGGDIDIDRNIDIDRDVNIIRPARPGTNIRPNRPITRPGGGIRPGGRGELARPVVGSGGSVGRPGAVSRPGRPGTVATHPGAARPGVGAEGRPTRPRPAGVAPAHPGRTAQRPTREVSMPSASQAARAARPAAGTARPAAQRAALERPQTRQAARASTRASPPPSRGGAMGQVQSRPQVQRERARGQQSRQAARAPQARSRSQAHQERPRMQQAQKRQKPAMAKRGGGGGGHKKAAQRGKQSRKRR